MIDLWKNGKGKNNNNILIISEEKINCKLFIKNNLLTGISTYLIYMKEEKSS